MKLNRTQLRSLIYSTINESKLNISDKKITVANGNINIEWF